MQKQKPSSPKHQAMASTFSSPASTPTKIPSSSIDRTPFLRKPSQLTIFRKKKRCYFSSSKVVSCKATNGNQNNGGGDFSSLNTRFDRRDLLIGLGGLYGATNLVNDPFALAAPIQAPDLTLCGDATIPQDGTKVACCPPTTKQIIDFKPPRVTKLRYRPAAHLVDPSYLAKFTEAMQRMRDLPDSDPRSFSQQAKVHCAYCNGAYDQVGFPDSDLQVHFSWLFFPFHRLYLYFYERILGKLIGDPDFAMPFWNWDAPDGMPIPAIYTNPNSPLYNAKRDAAHQPPWVVDLNYDEDSATRRDQIISNLKTMYIEVVRANLPSVFHGGKYKAGDAKTPGGGTVETGSHTAVHRWVGDPTQPHNEDLGNFYSAGRDPLFYAHHGNVDRMWSIWKDLPGKKRNDFTDSDWLDASFVFYNEDGDLVRCKVRDCLDHRALGYDYQRVNIPWLKSKPSPKFAGKGSRKPPPSRHRGQARAETTTRNVIRNVFPIVLDKIVSIEVPRPQKSRTKLEKEEEEEVLVIENIQFDSEIGVKFDVYINDEDDEAPTGPDTSEFAGSFSTIPHSHSHGGKFETNKVFPLSELLEDLDVEGDDTIVVTIVPKQGKGAVTIGNIKIDYIRE